MTDLELGTAAAEDIIRRVLRVELHKALDPLDPADYDTIVARLQRAMSRAAAGSEAKVLNAAVNALDVDWANLTAAARQRLIDATASTLLDIPAQTVGPLVTTLEVAGERIQRGTRSAVRALIEGTIQISLSAVDRQVTAHAAESQAHYITDQWGRRRADWSRTARSIVAQGLEEGLGRDEIAAILQARLGSVAGARVSAAYYSVIASSFAARARSFSHLRAFEDAGIERFIFEAIMDEHTTDQCACLHGRRFEVGAGLRAFNDVARDSDPEAVIDLQPWVRSGSGPNGERVLFTQRRDGTRTTIATIAESRVGQRDAPGRYTNVKSTDELAAMGICTPPLHAHCRSTITADV